MKNLTLFLTASLLLSACSKTIKEVHQLQNHEKQEKQPLSTVAHDVESLRLLLASEAPNLALAELLAKSVSREQQQALKEVISELTAEEAKSIILEVQKQNEKIRQNYLFHGQNYQHNKELLGFALMNSDEARRQSMSLEDQLKVSAFAYVKNKALDEIIETYDRRAAQLSKELAEEMAFEIATKHPQVASDLERALGKESKEKVIEMIQKSKPVLEKIDKYFRASNLNANEQYLVTTSAILAGGIYLQIKDNAGFKRIVENGKKIVRDVQKFQTKAKEFVLLINTLDTHIADSTKNIQDLKTGMQESGKDLVELYNKAKTGINGPSNIHSKRIMDFLYHKVIKGKDIADDGTNASIISKQYKINANFQKSVTAAGNLADNLSNIINTTTKISALLGIKPSKEVAKVLDKVQKVSAVISTAKTVMTGWMMGGPLGAATALCSSPIMSMMGGGGSQDSAMLAEISRKLDMVLENQQKMMEMQLETMNMIKELALMVDMYHQREMVALAELRDISLVSLEIDKALLNKDIRSCERMINYQLSSVWKDFDFRKESFYSINHLELINSRFTSSIKGLSDIRRIVNSVEEAGFQNCQSGIAEAFGGNSNSENPLRSIFSSDENDNLNKFQREIYLPLVEGLSHFTQTTNFDVMPLHLPITRYSALKLKTPYLEYAHQEPGTGGEVYDLETLISARNLERYLSHLIILHPLIEVDKPVWNKSYKEIVDTYLANSNSSSNQNVRSHYFLNNALKLIQTAIAQESLLAGEPILYKLHEKFLPEIFSSKNCKDIKHSDLPYVSELPFLCSIRNNKLLLKNLLAYSLNFNSQLRPEFNSHYKEAYGKGDLATLAKLFHSKQDPSQLEVKTINQEKEIVLHVSDARNEKMAIKFPNPEEQEAGKILYSENMPRLLLMQQAVLEGLEKVAPITRQQKDQDLLKLFLVK